MDELWLFYDSGTVNDPEGIPYRITWGFVASQNQNLALKEDWITRQVGFAEVGLPIASWDPELRQLWENDWPRIRLLSWVKGSQIYDLVAAHGAALFLRTSLFRGVAHFVGDGEPVAYLNGRDTAFDLSFEGLDVADRIRGGIRRELSGLRGFTFERVPSEENPVDSVIKREVAEMLRILGP